MGKTSIARELCRQFQDEGWVSPFAEIEAATTPEDVNRDGRSSAQGVFAPSARFYLEQEYSILIKDAGRHADEAIIVLEHDGYLEKGEDGHRFPFKLLKAWWSARLRDHHVLLKDRAPAKVEAP